MQKIHGLRLEAKIDTVVVNQLNQIAGINKMKRTEVLRRFVALGCRLYKICEQNGHNDFEYAIGKAEMALREALDPPTLF